MAFEAKLSLRQSQKMVMTPMLQQAISLLQLSRLEMLQALHQQLEENPILEEVTEGIEEPEDVPDVNAVGEEPTPESNGEGSAPEIDWESYLQDASDYRLLSDARRSSGSIARACSRDPARCRTTSFSSSI